MIYFYILCALFVLDGLTTHLIVREGGKEIGLLAGNILGPKPEARWLIVYTIVKMVLFGYVMMWTEGAILLHQGFVLGGVLILAWNVVNLVRAYRDR